MPLSLKEIHDLIERISRSDFSCFELDHDGTKLKLERRSDGAMQIVAPVGAAPAAVAVPVAVTAPGAAPVNLVPVQAAPAPAEDLHEVKSPIVGTFYRSPSPKADVFVETGSRIKAGQTLCIVEAMKLMNEIECDVDGEIVDILIANGQPVEYGEVLFRLRINAA